MSNKSLDRGRKIKALRALKGLRQEQVAETAGISRRTLSTIERGLVNPHRATLAALAEALDDHSIVPPGDDGDA